jgi:hypothetical protein
MNKSVLEVYKEVHGIPIFLKYFTNIEYDE